MFLSASLLQFEFVSCVNAVLTVIVHGGVWGWNVRHASVDSDVRLRQTHLLPYVCDADALHKKPPERCNVDGSGKI